METWLLTSVIVYTIGFLGALIVLNWLDPCAGRGKGNEEKGSASLVFFGGSSRQAPTMGQQERAA